MAETSQNAINLTVTYRGILRSLDLPSDATIADLKIRLQNLTSIEPGLQKLLYKGKKNVSDEATILAAGLKNGSKVQMLGSTSEELEGLRKVEHEQQRKDEIMRQRATRVPTKLRSTASPSSSSTLQYRFHRLEPLPHLPNPSNAHSLLQRLSSDPAILHVMSIHKFSVGFLTELAPHEHPGLLGLNVNAGEAIKLRLRTNAYDGFRLYSDVRKVLCHELAHNLFSDHDDNFKELNSKLNKEVAEFERSARAGAHTLIGYGESDVYDDSSTYSPSIEAEAHAHILGGSTSLGSTGTDSRDERRRRALEAAMNRLKKEEEELEQSCGTAGPAASAGAA